MTTTQPTTPRTTTTRREALPDGLPDRLVGFWRACEEEPSIPPGLGYDGLLTDTHLHTNVAQDPLEFALELPGEVNATALDRVVVQSDHFHASGQLSAPPLPTIPRRSRPTSCAA